MPHPRTMHYAQVSGPGAADVLNLGTGPVPEIKPDEVLIRVQAAEAHRLMETGTISGRSC